MRGTQMTKRFLPGPSTVLDQDTGLEWQRAPAATKMPWQDAMAYALALDLGGHTDWRLPGIEELFTLIDFSRYDPASAFPGMEVAWYWSSSSYSGSSSNAWGVDFLDGYVNYPGKTNSGLVRCVRRGP